MILIKFLSCRSQNLVLDPACTHLIVNFQMQIKIFIKNVLVSVVYYKLSFNLTLLLLGLLLHSVKLSTLLFQHDHLKFGKLYTIFHLCIYFYYREHFKLIKFTTKLIIVTQVFNYLKNPKPFLS